MIGASDVGGVGSSPHACYAGKLTGYKYVVIPTIATAAEAQSFVDARLAEGSDFIKIVYGDGVAFPSIDRELLKAVIDATKRRGKMAVVHIGTLQTAEDAIAAGAGGLVHMLPMQLEMRYSPNECSTLARW